MKLEKERFKVRGSVSKCLQVELSGQLDYRSVGDFYSPQANLVEIALHLLS
jgi:hypothetical protein